MPWPALQYFSTLSHERQKYLENVIVYRMRVSTSCTRFLRNISHFKKKWARYGLKICIDPHVKCPLLLLYRVIHFVIQGDSLARGPKLLSMYTVEQHGFLFRKYWQTGSFKACQKAFRTEFGERRAPSKCCIQKLVKKLETRGSRSNACRLLSLWAYWRAKCTKIHPAQSNNS